MHPAQRHLGLNDRHANGAERVGDVVGQLVLSQHTVGVLFQLQIALGAHHTHAVLVVDQLKHIAADDLAVHGA